VVICQSAAILLYLAEKTGKLLPAEGSTRNDTLHWFMLAITDVAPASMGMFYSANRITPPAATAAELFQKRLLEVLKHVDRRLAESEFLSGEFSIADVALYPTAVARKSVIDEQQGLSNLKGWMEKVGKRPAVQKGMAVPG
jgi:GSH-dependent disulfide-bond oxidoreductase